ncbi:MAG TPA: hypothetical protein VK540_16020 [Polyangiaceae bacterium]|nr:hypothetical protein [Polyangiaceae bacterium]
MNLITWTYVEDAYAPTYTRPLGDFLDACMPELEPEHVVEIVNLAPGQQTTCRMAGERVDVRRES